MIATDTLCNPYMETKSHPEEAAAAAVASNAPASSAHSPEDANVVGTASPPVIATSSGSRADSPATTPKRAEATSVDDVANAVDRMSIEEPEGAATEPEPPQENEEAEPEESRNEDPSSPAPPSPKPVDEEASTEDPPENLQGLISDEDDEEKCCKLCNRKFDRPRILGCLHVFCHRCVTNLVEGGGSGPSAEFEDEEDEEKLSGVDGAGDKPLPPETEKLLNGLTKLMKQRKKAAAAAAAAGDNPCPSNPSSVIVCPACQQETRLAPGGAASAVESMPLDHVMAAMVQVNAAESNEDPVCTSCKDQGKAEASCQDCASFLCSQCVTAHRFMRCFENHSVISLEDLAKQDGGSSRVQQLMHKTPLTCAEHPAEILKHFCHTCAVPICNECLIGSGNHRQPQHKSERIQDIEIPQKEELQVLLNESRSKVILCQRASSSLESCLGDLQLQRDNIKGQIDEAFHSYKAFLEQRHESLMNELESSHKQQELTIMEMFHNVEKTIEKIEDGTKFAQRILDNGNAQAILSVKKLISDQLLFLINNTPNPQLNIHLEFDSNAAQFKEAVNKYYGSLKRPSGEAIAANGANHFATSPQSSDSPAPFSVTSPSSGGSSFIGASPSQFGAPPATALGARDNAAANAIVAATLGSEDLSLFGSNPGIASQSFGAANRIRSVGAFTEDAAFSDPGSIMPTNQSNSGLRVGGGAFAPYPQDPSRASAAVALKPPATVSSAIVGANSRPGATIGSNLDVTEFSQSNQLTEILQQVNEQLGGAGSGAAGALGGISPALLENIVEGLGSNFFNNFDIASLLSGEEPTVNNQVTQQPQPHNPQHQPNLAPGAPTQRHMGPSPLPSNHPTVSGIQRGPGGSPSSLHDQHHGGGQPHAQTQHGGHHGIDHRSSSRNSHSPTISESGISMDGSSQSGGSAGSGSASIATRLGLGAQNFGGAATDAAALFKPGVSLGGVSVSSSGQICINGQAIPGININNLDGPAVSQLLQALPNNLGGGASGGGSVTPTSGTGGIESSPSGVLGGGSGNSRALSSVRDVSDAQVLLNCSSGSGGQIGGPGSGPNPNSTSSAGVLSNIGYFDPSSTPRPSTPQIHSEFHHPDSGLISPGGSGFGGSDGGRTGSSAGRAAVASAAAVGFPNSHPPYPVRGPNSKCQAMQIRHKFGTLGPGKCQFNSPHGFCLGGEENIVVADTNNHRVQVFDKSGEFKFQFGIPGRDEGQLWYPRKVAVLRSTGKYVVCDRGNERSRMQIFTKNGHFIRKIAIRYIDIVAGLAITSGGNIVAVDSVSPTVFVIAESGELVRWFDCSDYMREPSDIAVSGKEFFVCDFKGHCVVVFSEEGQFMRRIGCENITNFPNGIDISDAGDVLVGDSHGNRFHVAVFQRDGSLLSEFECPYVKVSRCCGLKITSEGYVVTLAKNNHHVLVLNTLYIT